MTCISAFVWPRWCLFSSFPGLSVSSSEITTTNGILKDYWESAICCNGQCLAAKCLIRNKMTFLFVSCYYSSRKRSEKQWETEWRKIHVFSNFERAVNFLNYNREIEGFFFSLSFFPPCLLLLVYCWIMSPPAPVRCEQAKACFWQMKYYSSFDIVREEKGIRGFFASPFSICIFVMVDWHQILSS